MKRKVIVISHIVFWFLALTVEILPIFTLDDKTKVREILVQEVFVTLYCAIAFYAFYFYLGKILSAKGIAVYLLVFIVFVGGYTALIMWFYPSLLFKFIKPQENLNYIRWYISGCSYHFVYALWGTLFRYTIDWFVTSQKSKDLEKQNITGELALLRSQINPHFLFNTLNNINSYVSRDPEKTSFGIIKLSEIMRYMLYDANSEKVLLDNEINYIKNYIDLQKLRIKDPGFVRLKIEGNTGGIIVPPMLLIPFIENAFKHGKKNVPAPGVTIDLKIEGLILDFEVSNYTIKKEEDQTEQGGFGLKNIKRRLDLLYPGNYFLNISSDIEKYYVHLKITV